MNKFIVILSLILILMFGTVSFAEMAGMPNPMVETDKEGILEAIGIDFNLPEDAEDVRYFLIDGKLAEAQFTLGRTAFCFRVTPAAEFTDISGLYCEWTIEDPCTVGEHCEGVCRRLIGENETTDLCLWFDVAPGIMYSLTAVAPDLDGFDIEAVAEQIYLPMQGEVDGDSITQGYDLIHVTDLFVPDGAEDTVVLQGCFGTIDMSQGEADMEYIGFDENETYTLIVLPDAVIELPADAEHPTENTAVTAADLPAWLATYKAEFGGDFEIDGDFYASFELDEEDAITRLTYVYLP